MVAGNGKDGGEVGCGSSSIFAYLPFSPFRSIHHHHHPMCSLAILDLTAAILLALAVIGGRNRDRPDVVGRWACIVTVVVSNLLLRHYSIDFSENLLKSGVHVGRVKGRGLDEGEIISLYACGCSPETRGSGKRGKQIIS